MYNILVTGGCGFIGSNFLNYMIKKYTHYNFINLDNLYYCASKNNIENVCIRANNYKFIKGNIQNKEFVDYILKSNKINIIIHFAAQSHVDNSFSNPLQYTKDNILGTHILLECSREYNKIIKFIHISTDEVYGETNNEIKTESSILNPTNPYSATKASAEMLVNSYLYSYKLPIIVTRSNNVFGPRQYPEKLIPKFINLLFENKKCSIHGKGLTCRSFLYVSDVIEALELILFNGKIGSIYNIGTENEYSVLDITKKLVKLIKNTDDYEKHIEYVRDRKYNDKRYNIDIGKLLNLGWKQKIDFDEGLKKTVKFYKDIFLKKV